MPRSVHRPGHALRCALTAVGAGAALTGCGSASISDLPAPARPDHAPAAARVLPGAITATTRDAANAAARPRLRDDLRDHALRVELDPHARTLRLVDALGGAVVDTIDVGVGPTQVACASRGPCFVTDTTGDALLVVRIPNDGRSLRLVRRVYLAGAPYALAVDRARRRLWVTLTARNELVELGAHGRPHVLTRTPTVRQPDGVRVDARTGDVTVTGMAPPKLQRLANPASPDRR